MNPNIWGTHYWAFLFSTALGYPNRPDIDTQHAYYRFFTHLGSTLPCYSCKDNYSRHIKILPLDFHLNDRRSLLKWLLTMHNTVCKDLGKDELTLDEVIRKYLKIECGGIDKNNITIRCLGDNYDFDSHYPVKEGFSSNEFLLVVIIFLVIWYILYFQ
jgi:hypothetical protein